MLCSVRNSGWCFMIGYHTSEEDSSWRSPRKSHILCWWQSVQKHAPLLFPECNFIKCIIFSDAPSMIITFIYNNVPQKLTIKLPLTINKFFEPTEMNGESFFARWKNLGGWVYMHYNLPCWLVKYRDHVCACVLHYNKFTDMNTSSQFL